MCADGEDVTPEDSHGSARERDTSGGLGTADTGADGSLRWGCAEVLGVSSSRAATHHVPVVPPQPVLATKTIPSIADTPWGQSASGRARRAAGASGQEALGPRLARLGRSSWVRHANPH